MNIFEITVGDVIHCKTENEALELFEALQTIKVMQWVDGTPLIGSDTCFSHSRKNGIYYYVNYGGKISWGDFFHKHYNDSRLIEFEDLIYSKLEILPQSKDAFMEMLGG